MNYNIRRMKAEEYDLLSDFLYDAIFVPEGEAPPERAILEKPELQLYIKDFGAMPDDYCIVAENAGEIIAAVWARIMDDYGHIDNSTPSLAISVKASYRGKGIGRRLLRAIIDLLRERGYNGISLAVQKRNYAAKLYSSMGFKIVDENNQEFIMLLKL